MDRGDCKSCWTSAFTRAKHITTGRNHSDNFSKFQKCDSVVKMFSSILLIFYKKQHGCQFMAKIVPFDLLLQASNILKPPCPLGVGKCQMLQLLFNTQIVILCLEINERVCIVGGGGQTQGGFYSRNTSGSIRSSNF